MRSESADVGKCRMKVSLLKVQCAVGKCKLTKSSNTDLTSATCHRKSNASSPTTLHLSILISLKIYLHLGNTPTNHKY